MVKKVKVLAGILCLLMVMNMTSINGKSLYKDVNITDWYYDYLLTASYKGLINGFNDGTFRPNDEVNVEQFIKMLMVALDYDIEIGTGYWAKPFIDKAQSVGIIKDGEFEDYQGKITREKMAVLSVRAAELLIKIFENPLM